MNLFETILTIGSVAVAILAGLMLIAAGFERNLERDDERNSNHP